MGNQFKIRSAQNPPDPSWNPEQALADAIDQRTKFLKRFPKYRKFQHEIDRLLDKAGTPENRMRVLALLIEAKLIDMQGQLKRINTILMKAA